LINFFIDRPIFSTVLAIVITLAGGISMLVLPVARFPQITPPQVAVTANFPGADASTMEQSVAAPIEQQVNGVPNMLYMDSKSSNSGAYSLSVTFDVGTSQDIAAVDVQNQVAIAQRFLPPEVQRQGVTVIKRQPQALLIVAITSDDPRYDYLFLSNYATLHVFDALARIHGVGQVVILGARDYGMRIWLDPQKMARFGVTTQDVAAVINEQNVVAPAGTVGAEPAPPGQQMQYTVSVHSHLSSPAEYENMVVRATNDGSIVHLRDIARIELAATDYTRSSRWNGRPAATLAVYQLPDANALDVSRGVHQAMDVLAENFPHGLHYEIPFDTTRFVTESLREVEITLVIAAVLVLLVVFLFLESWRATLIPMLAVPVSLIGTFSAFLALGFSINTLTLFALVLAIGLVVDDAIVVVEAATAKMEAEGLSPREATREAMHEVSGPVIAIALVLTSVFVPIAFLGGLTGQLYKQFALTLSVSVLISAVVALTFTPALCALLLRPHEAQRWRGPIGKFFAAFDRVFKRATQRYTGVVQRAIHRAFVTLAVFGVIVVAAIVLLIARPTGFIPDEDQGYLIASISLPPAASLQRTEAALARFRELALKSSGVQDVIAVNGFSVLTGVNSSYTATAFVILKPWDERGHNESAQAIVDQLSKASGSTKEASIIVLNPPPIPGIGSAGGFEFVLEDQSGGSIEQFNSVVQEFLAAAAKRPELTRVFTQFSTNVPQIEYVIDRERAKTLGVPISDIFSTLQTFLGGSYINDFNLYGRTFRVTAQADSYARLTPDAVGALYVRTQRGDKVPLSTLVQVKTKNGPEFIERYNVFRAVTINGSAAPGYSSGQAIAAMQEISKDLPQGFAYEWTGSTYQEIKSGGQAPYIFALAIVFVFLLLAALYESWVVPFAVIFGIPFAAFGAYLGLTLRGIDNNVFAQIGLVMLIGLAAKNAILIVEFAKLAYERGSSLVDAAIEGARVRLRPILMTSFAFIFGSLPLAIATGAGSASRQVLGTAVVFGMTTATMIGIFIIPVFYVLLQGLSERVKGRAHPVERAT